MMDLYAQIASNVIVTVPFEACYEAETRVVWYSKNNTVKAFSSDADFKDSFSWMVGRPGRVDHTRSVTLHAERYGGLGIIDNGGGVRCGNILGHQVKGIGQNPLAGSGEDVWHSYGGLSAIDAVYEAIYSEALSNVLPIGTVPVRGILLTQPDAAYKMSIDGERGWGALMVRETCVRPAHFLSAPHYRPRREHRRLLMSEAGRTRTANRGLMRLLGGPDGFIKLVGTFVMKSAQQFAFAKAARLMHGSVTASNLSYDGRWLDLTNTSFLRSGENTAGFFRPMATFQEEPEVIPDIVVELVSTFSKYNGVALDPRPLIDYYWKRFDAYYKYYLPYVFGWNPGGLDLHDYGLAPLHSVLTRLEVVHDHWPVSQFPWDVLIHLISYSYSLIFNQQPYMPKPDLERHLKLSGLNHDEYKQGFTAALTAAHRKAKTNEPLLRFSQRSAIKAFKRAMITSFYFKGRLDNVIDRELASGGPTAVGDLISKSSHVASWAFSVDDSPEVVLYSSPGTRFTWAVCENTFTYESNELRYVARNYESALNLIRSLPDKALTLASYSFRAYLVTVLNCIASMEVMESKWRKMQ